MIIDEDEEYAEWLADIILAYFAAQSSSGRSTIFESEIWKLLGQEFPEGRIDRKFILKDYKDNVVQFPKNKLH